MVIDRDVNVFEADRLAGVAAELAAAMTGRPMARATRADPPELLDVDVDQLAGMAALIAVGRLWWLEARTFAKTNPLKPARHGGERELEDLSAISAPVIRSLRSFSIASTALAGVR